jgi:glutathione peroxidase
MSLFRLAPIALCLVACNTSVDTPAAGAPPAPPSAMKSAASDIYAFEAAPLGSDTPVSLAKYKGQVLLVVNVAAHCGYTPQYAPLGELDRKYGPKGFHVVGFVSDDFGKQGGTTEEVQSCSLSNRATFDQFATVGVKPGPAQHPLFAWLTSQPGMTGEAKWNFHKWLIGKDGKLVARWASGDLPDGPAITQAIEAALGG